MAYRRRSRNNESLIEFVLTSHWHVSAFLCGFLLVVYAALPLMLRNSMSQAVFQGLKPIVLMVSLVFGVVALVKYLREQSSQAEFRRQEAMEPTVDLGRDEVSTFARPQAWSLDVLQSIEWKRFEEVVAAYFRQKGFDCRTVSCGPDGGVDATVYQDGKKMAVVQCKAWNTRPVGVKPVRELLGVMTHQQVDKGYFMATGGYTQEALDFVKGQPITLVSGDALMGAIGRMPDEQQQQLLTVATQGDYTTPTCPSCGIKLILRESARGNFWGCTHYPRCKVKIGMRGDE